MEPGSLEYYYKDKFENLKEADFAYTYESTHAELLKIMHDWILEKQDGETLIKATASNIDERIKIRRLARGEEQKSDIVYENCRPLFFGIYMRFPSKIDIELKGENEIDIIYNKDTTCKKLLAEEFDEAEALISFNTRTSDGKTYNSIMIPKAYLLIVF